MAGEVHVVVGGQFGSEGKGHFVAELVKRLGRDTCIIRTGGPNAGHTAFDEDGREWKLRHIPAGAVVGRGPLGIASGSEIDQDVLDYEVETLDAAGHDVGNRLRVDWQATRMVPYDGMAEHDTFGNPSLVERIGSTGKGIGHARQRRIMREADIYGGDADIFAMTCEVLRLNGDVIIEASQGYGLGLHAGYYPFCTSRDVRAIDALAEVGLSPWDPLISRVVPWVVFRPNPIRVAGNSGPLLGETSWGELGLKEEFTTVTNKMRRVGEWDGALAAAAMIANGSNALPVMMFADYVRPPLHGLSGTMKGPLHGDFEQYEEDLGQEICAFGTGPDTIIWR